MTATIEARLDRDLSGVAGNWLIPELSIDRADTNDSPMVVMNWLLDVTSALIKKKADQEEVEKLNIKIDFLEKECAEPHPQSPTAPGGH